MILPFMLALVGAFLGPQFVHLDSRPPLYAPRTFPPSNLPTFTLDYSYDHRNRLTQVTKTLGGLGDLAVNFSYDPLDRRIAKTADSQTTTFDYHGDHIWKETKPDSTSTKYLVGDGIDQWLARQVQQPGQPQSLQWFLPDRLGTVQAVTDQTGNILESYAYSAFGVRTPRNSELGTRNSLGFTGREHDPETGLTYYRARYMDPGLGKFINEDTIKFKASDFNLNRYCQNSPVNFVDPLGRHAAEYAKANENSAKTSAKISSTVSVFYTGGPQAQAAAQAAAAANGYRILNVSSSVINALSTVLRASQRQIINQLSAAYAATTVEAVVFVGPGGIAATSVFARIERPILEAFNVAIKYVYL